MKMNLYKVFTIGLCLMSIFSARAFDFKSNGLYYNITSKENNEVEVTYKSTSYKSYEGNITIPQLVVKDSVNYRVTSIGKHAFHGSKNLREVKIPSSNTSKVDEPFQSCTKLAYIDIPKSVKKIGHHAFCRTKMTSVLIPEGVEEIGEGAFSYCTELSIVIITRGLKKMGKEPFGYDHKMSRFIVASDNPAFCQVDGVLYDRKCRTLISYPEQKGDNYDILPTTVTIAQCAFGWNSDLSHLTIPNSVKSIEGFAFFWCDGLKKVAMPAALETVGEHAFWGTSLHRLELPVGVKSIGKEAFFYCTHFKALIIHAPVPPKIGKDAFSPSLETVYVPDESVRLYKKAKGWKTYKILPLSEKPEKQEQPTKKENN